MIEYNELRFNCLIAFYFHSDLYLKYYFMLLLISVVSAIHLKWSFNLCSADRHICSLLSFSSCHI